MVRLLCRLSRCSILSRKIQNLGSMTTKIKNTRSMGVILAPHYVFAVYNTDDHVLKLKYKTEVLLSALIKHYLQNFPYSGHSQILEILPGTDMDTAYQRLTSNSDYKESLFLADTSFKYFHFIGAFYCCSTHSCLLYFP